VGKSKGTGKASNSEEYCIDVTVVAFVADRVAKTLGRFIA